MPPIQPDELIIVHAHIVPAPRALAGQPRLAVQRGPAAHITSGFARGKRRLSVPGDSLRRARATESAAKARRRVVRIVLGWSGHGKGQSAQQRRRQSNRPEEFVERQNEHLARPLGRFMKRAQTSRRKNRRAKFRTNWQFTPADCAETFGTVDARFSRKSDRLAGCWAPEILGHRRTSRCHPDPRRHR